MKKLLSLLILSAPLAVSAEPHSYTYVEAGWFDRTAEWDLESGAPKDDVEADGWSVAGSIRTETGVLFQGYYSEGDIDRAWGVKPSEIESLLGIRADFKVESWGLLIGGANYLDDKTSFWGGVGYGRDDLELSVSVPGIGSGKEKYRVDQYSLGGGVRHNLLPMLEVSGGARLVHFRADETDLLEDLKDTDVEVTVGARLQPIGPVSIGASYSRQLDAESEIVRADVRLQF